MKKDTTGVLRQYVTDTGVRSARQVATDFDEVARALPPEAVTDGLSEAFRSDQTPAFEELLQHSFEQGDPRQRANMLGRLLDAAGPQVLHALRERGVLPPQVDRDAAHRLRPQAVHEIAGVASRENPALIDDISSCYATDPALARTLGGAALNVALQKIAQRLWQAAC
ncbi:hypothetical protein [Noviherbaspirillum aridicola]|uniref:Uncharacterized protein n=1 Tax=Noviherbaspirillum aridicola TaxID=2849687 RepID=A0ABQ4Q035_9BURK|nr:hypothetical protein [Noviherbaspirillum aridicola]GIZ50505.1 hypothetical protein NCCP691_05190 [Noviherbaspirillum aridicola]